MNKKIYILLLIVLLVTSAEAQTCSKIRRICRTNLNNEVFWNINNSVPCGTFKEYRIYARDNSSNPYTLINTETNQTTINWIHLNANMPSNKNWDYYIETVYTCLGIDNFCYSDTQNVADFSLPKSKIAYITIDTNSGFPLIIWERNNYPSFWYVDLFNDNSIKTGIIDTFFIDNVSLGDPKTTSLKYVIAAVDSCTKRWDYLPEDYHYTINLKGSIDTCTNRVNINWSKYKGWSDSILYYYIYKMKDKTNYVLIDSVANNITTYTDKISTNEIVDYYVAAVNSKYLKYRSCSNNIFFTTGRRNPNQSLKINYVTLLNNINVNFSFNTSSDIESINIYKSIDRQNYSLLKTINNSTSPVNEIDLLENGERRVYYYLASKNTCGLFNDTTPISTNILLENLQGLGTNKLWWNNYFTWNSGLEKYVLLRETRINNIILNPFSQKQSSLDSNYIDNISAENISTEMLCYKVIGTENSTGFISASNEVCIIGGLVVYFPNGVISQAGSSVFKPVGVYIDYTKSTLVIYNRWGEVVKQISDLNIGWDLSDSNNIVVPAETYVYEATIVGLDGKKINKTGTITIIR